MLLKNVLKKIQGELLEELSWSSRIYRDKGIVDVSDRDLASVLMLSSSCSFYI